MKTCYPGALALATAFGVGLLLAAPAPAFAQRFHQGPGTQALAPIEFCVAGKAPQPGIYRALITVTFAVPGCLFQPNGNPVPEYTYYYPGAGKTGATYFMPAVGAPGQVYIEYGYATPPHQCKPTAGTAHAKVLSTSPALPPNTSVPQPPQPNAVSSGVVDVTYAESWTYLDENAFVINGYYSGGSCTGTNAIITMIRIGGPYAAGEPSQ